MNYFVESPNLNYVEKLVKYLSKYVVYRLQNLVH